MSKINVGKPRVRPDKPAHTSNVAEGNQLGNYDQQVGHLPDGRSTARRSTGVTASGREAILPSMPNLSPA